MENKNNVVIIDYGLGNVASVANAIKVLGGRAIVTRKTEDIKVADKIILPGVGAFEKGMVNLKKLGLIDVLEEQILNRGKPFLGICLGLQLLADKSFEDGKHRGLGWIGGIVKKLPVKTLCLPHIGWNDVLIKDKTSLLEGFEKDFCCYFLHSYFFDCQDSSVIKATCDYGIEFPAIIQYNNIIGMQFHPEKSRKVGLLLLHNFMYGQWGQTLAHSLSTVNDVLKKALSDDRMPPCFTLKRS
jgi:glutamine amidotransferase